MKLQKTHLAAAVGAALLAGGTAVQAQNLTVQLYGQVNRAMMYADDGFNNRWFHVDGQPSSTRFGISGTSQIAPGLRAGARIETEMKSNPSDVVTFAAPSAGAVSVPANPGSGGTAGAAGSQVLFAERWLDASLEGAWGRINLGQGSGAADDVSTIDLSGMGIASGNCPTDWGGGITWVDANGVGILGGGKVSATNACNDFESRYDRLMYTTPTFGGFRVQAGFGQRTAGGEATEASLWYSGKLAGELQAAVGWSTVNNSLPAPSLQEDKETIGFSASWLHTSGLNLTVMWTEVKGIGGSGSDFPLGTGVNPGRKGKFMAGKVGYKFGQHALGVWYGISENMVLDGDEGTTMGVGYVWNPIRWFELYAGYHLFTLDRNAVGGVAVNPEDVVTGQIGTRIRF